jgi:L-aspartate oxidase
VLRDLERQWPTGLNRRAVEARNLHAVANAMVRMALAREESRGAHYRLDFTQKHESAQHSIVRKDVAGVSFVPATEKS